MQPQSKILSRDLPTRDQNGNRQIYSFSREDKSTIRQKNIYIREKTEDIEKRKDEDKKKGDLKQVMKMRSWGIKVSAINSRKQGLRDLKIVILSHRKNVMKLTQDGRRLGLLKKEGMCINEEW